MSGAWTIGKNVREDSRRLSKYYPGISQIELRKKMEKPIRMVSQQRIENGHLTNTSLGHHCYTNLLDTQGCLKVWCFFKHDTPILLNAISYVPRFEWPSRVDDLNFAEGVGFSCRSPWPHGLGVGLQPLACWDWGFKSRRGHGCLVPCECCVLSGRGLCVGLITRPEDSYRVWSWSLIQEA